MPLPTLTTAGDLPRGVHSASLGEVLEMFGNSTPQRQAVGSRLRRVYELAVSTYEVKRFIVFGSFISGKAAPNDVDVFLVMNNSFDLSAVSGEARLVFDHCVAQAHFGASVFWLRQLAALPDEARAIAGWEMKRDGNPRGLVEIIGA
ncbi:MAG: DUF6932 family protein [Burkholderiales bacterium]